MRDTRQGRGPIATDIGYSLREEPDEVLLLAVLYIEYHVLEPFREAGSNRERLLGVTDAYS